jgi:murein DD-endopeptidase MepM/ murein hydrolase activator NlpD
MMCNAHSRPLARHRLVLLALAAVATMLAALFVAPAAPAQDLQSKLDQKQAQLKHANSREGVLSTTIQRYGDRLDKLRGEVSSLRNRQATVQEQLDRTKAELKADKARLKLLRARLKRSLRVLRERLVSIYETSQPDAVSIILNSKGFNDMMNRYEYLRRVQSQDTSIAGRVRGLRNQAKDTVSRVRSARDRVAAKQAELERTQALLQARQSDLAAAQQKDQQIMGQVQQTQKQLEGDVSSLQGQIQAQLQAAQQAQASATPTGPVQGQVTTGPPDSSSGFIWPVNGPITSPFCESRPWEACHPGIDIGVPSGTPIHAVADGTVSIAGPEGGYGNYTCIDHGGGLSSCYAHQESIAVSVGEHVSQGQVIGISDCTGLCFGPHLHFEVRVNGQVVDPMGYLP